MAERKRAFVGENVKRLRELRGWSQAELARRAKMDRAHLSRIEDGSYRSPRPENIEKIARAFNVELAEVTGREAQTRTPTPYDTNEDYRMLIDLLENADPADRRQIIAGIQWVLKKVEHHTIGVPHISPAKEEKDEPIGVELPDEREWIEKDFDYPRDLHVWVVPEYEVAAGSPINPDVIMSDAQILHSIREVKSGRFQVIRVVGESMSPLLRNGWKVTIDTWGRDPVTGDIVACYLKHEGSVLGIWQTTPDGLWLHKENPDYQPVKLGDPGDWLLLGCLKNIVDAPVTRSRHHHLTAVPKK